MLKTEIEPSLLQEPPHAEMKNSSVMKYGHARIRHWNDVARKQATGKLWGGYYHRRLTDVYKFLIPPQQSVLEVGCGMGDLLAALAPARGVGVDFSEEMIRAAQTRHANLHFLHLDAHALALNETFDV